MQKAITLMPANLQQLQHGLSLKHSNKYNNLQVSASTLGSSSEGLVKLHYHLPLSHKSTRTLFGHQTVNKHSKLSRLSWVQLLYLNYMSLTSPQSFIQMHHSMLQVLCYTSKILKVNYSLLPFTAVNLIRVSEIIVPLNENYWQLQTLVAIGAIICIILTFWSALTTVLCSISLHNRDYHLVSCVGWSICQSLCHICVSYILVDVIMYLQMHYHVKQTWDSRSSTLQ